MPDDNQTQDTNTETAESTNPEIANSIPTSQTIPVTDSTPSDTPSEPQNGSQDIVNTPVVKDNKCNKNGSCYIEVL